MFATKKLTKEKGEKLSTWYFRLGFLMLPWLWVANVMMFHRYKQHSTIIANNVKWSMVCSAVVIPLVVIWYFVMLWGFPDSGLWVIRPGLTVRQNGMFSNAVYKAGSSV